MPAGTYYVDPAGSNTSPYDTWAKAATDMQTIADYATKPSTVYLRGTQTLTEPIYVGTNAGDATNRIIWVGCNAEGNVDGTRFVLDGNEVATYCLYPNVQTSMFYHIFRNFEITGADNSGIYYPADCDYGLFDNCDFHANGNHGVDGNNYNDRHVYVHCIFRNNTNDGLSRCNNYHNFYNCRFLHNGNDGLGFSCNRHSITMAYSIFHGNGRYGARSSGLGDDIINCIFDGNTSHGLYAISYYTQIAVCNRFTNNGGYGINAQYNHVLWGDYNYFENNTSGNHTAQYTNGDNDVEDQSDNGEGGYVDRANHDFTLRHDASLRHALLNTGYGNAYLSAGLPAHPIGPGAHPNLRGGTQ